MLIRIKNLRLRTYIGIFDWEQEKKQDVIVNTYINFDGSIAAKSDHIDDTVDYKTLTKNIIQHVEEGRFELIERLCEELLDIIFTDNKVLHARVEIDKPGALRFADSVSISSERTR